MAKRLSIICPDPLLTAASARGDTVSDGIRESLARYFYLLGQAQKDLRDRFNARELTLICDVNNGTLFEPHTLDLVVANVEEADAAYFSKHKVDRGILIAKMESLSALERAALVDAVERFWRARSTGMAVDPGRILG